MECKWWWWMILALCATGIPAAFVEPQSISISNHVKNRSRPSRQNGHVRRFACPIGFFRLNRYCYYLSAGMSTWRDAYFNCKDRNATLAVLDKSPKERTLRKYLMGEQFTKLERWIGGIFNWQRMAWEWGVAGEKMDFQNFADPTEHDKKRYEWDCVVMDPTKKYKWTPMKCYIKKHYICEVPAGRIVRRRKKTIDPMAPQNQRLKPRKKGKKYTEEQERLTHKRHRTKMGMRRRWEDQTVDQQWAHGVRPGSRPPGYRLSKMRNRIRHRHPNANSTEVQRPLVAQILPKGQEYGAFLGDGPSNNRPQTLADLNNVLTEFNAKINDFAREEVLLKP